MNNPQPILVKLREIYACDHAILKDAELFSWEIASRVSHGWISVGEGEYIFYNRQKCQTCLEQE